MDEHTKPDQQSVNIDSEDFKAGYRQGYLEGFEAACDKVLEKLHAANGHLKKDTDGGK